MKKILRTIGKFFGTILGILLLVIVGIGFVLLLPFDYIRYKCSPFYKSEHKKYKLFAGSGFYFDLCNEIAKNKLPIQYITNPKNDALECGWFLLDKTLLIPDCIVEYYADVENWFCGEYDGGHDISSVPLEEYLQQQIDEINGILGSEICDKAIILVDRNQIENVDLAKQEERFLLYDSYHNDRIEVVKYFCNDHQQ